MACIFLHVVELKVRSLKAKIIKAIVSEMRRLIIIKISHGMDSYF